MLRSLFHNRIHDHAQRLLENFLPAGFEDEVFLCGGTFKSLLNKRLPVPELELWVRDAEAREKLCLALHAGNGHLVENWYPYRLRFRREGQWAEIHYQDVGGGSLADFLGGFDLCLCGIGVRWARGWVQEVEVSDECWGAIRRRRVGISENYVHQVAERKAACLLHSIHRLGQQSAELGYPVDPDHEHRLWDLYWNGYTEDERRAAMDLYFETVVAHKGQHDEHLVRLADAAQARIPGCPNTMRRRKYSTQPA